MAAINDYTSLVSAINDWDERSHDVNELIGLAEAEFRLYLGPSFAKETSATLTFVAGSTALPAGFIRALALTHAAYGGLRQGGIAEIRERRIHITTGVPDLFAITGATIEIAPSYDGDLILDYEGTLTGLSTGNATNWLVVNAPQAYLSMCLSMAKAKFEDYASAATLKSAALKTLDDLGIQSMVAQSSRAGVSLPGATP